jgi:saccharopine dehydrogenase-like NADP-dependent oxidoreductase
MKRILILGGGRSSSNLIQYLLDCAEAEQFEVRLGDADLELATAKIGNHSLGSCFQLDATNTVQRRHEIELAFLIISMLPAHMHMAVAQDCVDIGRSLITPSYIPDGMWDLNQQAKEKGLLLLNEMGVDPGIDHMSAMKIIHAIQADGGEFESFESFTGGLIAPASDNNPWHYKITWNPRNVVLAGAGGTARYRENGRTKFIPYHQLFERITHVDLGESGKFEGYANRDSLKYATLYGLDNIPTLFRGTFRKDGFCEAWSALIYLGLTDETTFIPNASDTTWKELIASLVPENVQPQDWIAQQLNLSQRAQDMLLWLGIFDDEPLDIHEGSPALALQRLIEEKWRLDDGDKDMIVMWHRFRYHNRGNKFEIQSRLICEGDDTTYTAMSKTVGLPIAIAARLMMKGELALTGVHLPVIPEIYEPVLNELQSCGIVFQETENALP